MKFYDVVVIGGGPIGSTVAGRIAKSGANVLVLERKSEIGYPNHCSGMVSSEFNNLVQFPDSLILNRIKGASVFSYANNTFSFKRDRDFAIVIDRINFDRFLHETAVASGASYLFKAQVVSFDKIGNTVNFYVDLPGERTAISCKIVVIATGATSTVKRMFDFYDEGKEIVTIQSEADFESIDSEIVYILMNNEISHNWFSWIIPISKNKARIGLGTDSNANLKDLLLNLTQMWQPLKERSIAFETPVFWHIPMGLVKESVKDNVLLVGDSAREVKPFSGGGLYTGILSAHFAADAIIKALLFKDYSKEALMQYETLWKGTVGREIKRELLMRDVYTTLTDKDKDKIIVNINQSNIERFINNHGLIDEPWKAGLRIILSSGIPFAYIKRKMTNR